MVDVNEPGRREASDLDYPPLDHGAIGNGACSRSSRRRAPSSGSACRGSTPRRCSAGCSTPTRGARSASCTATGARGRPGVHPEHERAAPAEFEAEDGAWEVIDFAPRIPSGLAHERRSQIVRIVRPLARARRRSAVDFDPRPDYARADVRARASRPSTASRCWRGARLFHLTTNVPRLRTCSSAATFVLDRPHLRSSVVRDAPDDRRGRRATSSSMLDETVAGWRAWAQDLRAAGLRAASGAALGAVPQAPRVRGHRRDHRRRDHEHPRGDRAPSAPGTTATAGCATRRSSSRPCAASATSPRASGSSVPARRRRVRAAAAASTAIGGERDLTEEHVLPHLAGFGGNGPVRIGNAAADQQQNDLIGELVLCLDDAAARSADRSRTTAETSSRWSSGSSRRRSPLAPTPDTGIWEFRTLLAPLHVLAGDVLGRRSTAARGSRARFGQPRRSPSAGRRSRRDERAVILERGYNAELGYFTQALDGEHPDASNLLLPTIGLVDARDPRFVATLRRVRASSCVAAA